MKPVCSWEEWASHSNASLLLLLLSPLPHPGHQPRRADTSSIRIVADFILHAGRLNDLSSVVDIKVDFSGWRAPVRQTNSSGRMQRGPPTSPAGGLLIQSVNACDEDTAYFGVVTPSIHLMTAPMYRRALLIRLSMGKRRVICKLLRPDTRWTSHMHATE